jgi:hypothetical protein
MTLTPASAEVMLWGLLSVLLTRSIMGCPALTAKVGLGEGVMHLAVGPELVTPSDRHVERRCARHRRNHSSGRCRDRERSVCALFTRANMC